MRTRQAVKKARIWRIHSIIKVISNGNEVWLVPDCEPDSYVVGAKVLQNPLANWWNKFIGDSKVKFRVCSESLKAVGVVWIWIIFAQNEGTVRISPGPLVMQNATPGYMIMWCDFLSLYGIDMVHSQDEYITIANDEREEKNCFPQI